MMQRDPDIKVHVSDHAITRFLEREFDVDIKAIRQHLNGKALSGAQLGAIAVQVGKVKLMLVRNTKKTSIVTITTVLPRYIAGKRRLKNGDQID